MASDAAGPTAKGAAQAPRRLGKLAICIVLFLAVFTVFGQTIGFKFVNLDDDQYIYENGHIKQGLSADGISWALTTFYFSNWHPLTWLSHMVNYDLFGLHPGGHHLTNVLLHGASAVLLFLALGRMTGAFWPSAWVAAVFAVHPLRAESVAWVSERKDVLSGLFFMLTLWLYARHAERPALGRYLAVLASFAVGLTAKPMLVSLPFLLLLLDYWPLGRYAGREGNGPGGSGKKVMRLVAEKLPLMVLSAAACFLTLEAQRREIGSHENLDFLWRIENAALGYVGYLEKMFYPSGLAVMYPLPDGRPHAWAPMAAAALLLVVTMSAICLRRKRPYLLVGWLWYLGMSVPVIGLVQVGAQSMADRYTYLTQIGLYVALAWGAMDLAAAGLVPRRLLAGVAALVVMALMLCAFRATRNWRDSETLWTHTLASTSRNAVAHHHFGSDFGAHGQVDKAIEQYRKALEINPNYAEAHADLGAMLASRRQFDEAEVHLVRAIEINPESLNAHVNLGTMLANRGRTDEAIVCFMKGLEIEPQSTACHYNLGCIFAGRQQSEDAIGHFRRSLEINPDQLQPLVNLGNVLAGSGRTNEAVAVFQDALRVASAQNNKALAGAIRAEISRLSLKK